MKPRYLGMIDGMAVRVFWRLVDAKRWADLRPEAVIVPVSRPDLVDVGEAVF